MKKALLYLFLLVAVNNINAQSCIGEAGFPWLCLTNGRQSGDVIQISYSDFTNSTFINSLVTENENNKCNDNMKVKIIRRLHEDRGQEEKNAVSRSSNNDDNPCYEKLVFAGSDFDVCYEINPCNDSLILYVEITGGPLGFDVPAAATIPCEYDIDKDPSNLIGYPTNIKGGSISYVDIGVSAACISQYSFTRIWTISACNSATINKNQTITVLPKNCSFNTQVIFINPSSVAPGDYFGSNQLKSDSKVLEGTAVNFYAQEDVTLVSGFHARANSNFKASIAACATAPNNDVCSTAQVLSCGTSIFGNTSTSTNTGVENFDNLCDIRDPTLNANLDAGLFFNILGEGQTIKISTNHDYTNFDTELRVFTGDCQSNICVIGNDDVMSGNSKSEVIFYAEKGINYIIYLDGYNGATGNFELNTVCLAGTILTNNCGEIIGTTYGQSNNFGEEFYADAANFGGTCYGANNGPDIAYYLYLDLSYYPTITLSNMQDNRLRWGLVPIGSSLSSFHFECWTPLDGHSGDLSSLEDNLSVGYYALIIDSDVEGLESCFTLNISCPTNLQEEPQNKIVQLEKKETLNDLIENKPLLNQSTKNNLEQLGLKVYPNPTNQSTTLSYFLPKKESVQIQLLDLAGQIIKTIESPSNKSKGFHQQAINLENYPAGIYFIHLQSGTSSEVKKLILQ